MAAIVDRVAQAAEISRKLEDARNSLKRLCGEGYAKKIAPWKVLLQDAQRTQGGSLLSVTLKKLTEAKRIDIPESTQWWLMAACVDLINEEAAARMKGAGEVVNRMMTAPLEQRSDAELKSLLKLCKISASGTMTSMSSGGVELKFDVAMGKRIRAELKRRKV